MKILAYCTPTHLPLLNRHFLPSIPDGFKFVVEQGPQECPTGVYRSEGFGLSMKRKFALIRNAADPANSIDPFIYSDVDARFYGLTPQKATADLGDYDVAFQCDHWRCFVACTGFMVIRPCKRVIDWADKVIALCDKHNDDQAAAAEAMSESHLAWKFLPREYWTHGADETQWFPGRLKPPQGIVVHHANWVMGVERKMALLDEVKEKKARPHEDSLSSR